MSRNDNSSGKKHSGRQGGGSRNKSYARGNAPIKSKKVTALEKREDGMRLNKYIANAGICSRRDADIYISSGNVSVNGEIVTEMGYKVQLTDEVKFDGRSISPDKPEYFVLNKSKGVFVTGSIHKGGLTVMDIMAKASKSKLDPVGKLDTQTTGLLVFTNDGALAKKLANPKNGIRQIYHIKINRALSQEDLEKIREGVFIEGKKVNVTDVSYVKDRPKSEVGLELTSTRSHIVQKIFKSLGYEIVNLDRVVFGGLTKKDLPRGRFRTLTKQEVINLGNL
ncbi:MULTISPECIES: pseudouridine synthase [unclassified Zunongwangia]|uniref:pseudouridine synthase n=1 Tax=unclassified Zunongwangia TaxID=2632541 RepID=UPI0022DE8695|nr:MULTISPECIES: pseudouridine synthase [unclassified Zunongwangia]WBL22834.1 pseudouridine synthase [Zunongwangia sp. HRR-M8]WBL25252.1 pseudouridine synthase [Zunongwangia sp. HGR-M22]